MTENTITEILDRLNSYTGDNIEAADLSGASDIIVLTDGTEIRYVEQTGNWTQW